MLKSLDLRERMLDPPAAAEIHERGVVIASATRPHILLLV